MPMPTATLQSPSAGAPQLLDVPGCKKHVHVMLIFLPPPTTPTYSQDEHCVHLATPAFCPTVAYTWPPLISSGNKSHSCAVPSYHGDDRRMTSSATPELSQETAWLMNMKFDDLRPCALHLQRGGNEMQTPNMLFGLSARNIVQG